MSSKAVYVSDLRSAVSSMIDAYTRGAALAQFGVTLGWDEADYDTVLSGSDITAAEFVEAIASIGTLATTFAAEAATLAKLKP